MLPIYGVTLMSTRESAKIQRRDDIVQTARTLLRQSGDAGFSMRALAEHAGVSIATPYNLFGSKQAILLAVLDADLAGFQAALGDLQGDAIDRLFRTIALMGRFLSEEPEFYRNVFSAVSREGGPELRLMANGPRYRVWKRLLRQAMEAGLLAHHVDADAFAVASSQLIGANVLAWAQGELTLEEMQVRHRYGLALTLLAIATDTSRARLAGVLAEAETELQQLWRTRVAERLRDGTLDQDARELLAEQLLQQPSND